MDLIQGEHLCREHQGNLSHYAPHNCKICKLEEEVKQMKDGELKIPTDEEQLNMAKKKIEAQHYLLQFTNDAKDRLKERIDNLEIDLYEALERNKELVKKASKKEAGLKSRNDALAAQNDALTARNDKLRKEMDLWVPWDLVRPASPTNKGLVGQADALISLAEEIRTSIKKAGHL